MTQKPTYEELAQQVKKLEKRVQALEESEEKYKGIFENILDIYYRADMEGNLILASPSAAEILGYENTEAMIGKNIDKAFYGRPKERKRLKREIMKHGKVRFQGTLKRKDGTEIITETNSRLVYDKSGQPIAIEGILRDVTVRVLAEKALKERKKELEIKTDNLEELNTALRVLLAKRDEDKKESEEKVLYNVKEMVVPYVKKLKKTGLDERQKVFVDILESHLKDIISPFSRRLSSKYLNLTPKELQIANLIKQGNTTRDIAEIFNLSKRTIESHRDHIRRKLGIKNRKANLGTHLLSLQ